MKYHFLSWWFHRLIYKYRSVRPIRVILGLANLSIELFICHLLRFFCRINLNCWQTSMCTIMLPVIIATNYSDWIIDVIWKIVNTGLKFSLVRTTAEILTRYNKGLVFELVRMVLRKSNVVMTRCSFLSDRTWQAIADYFQQHKEAVQNYKSEYGNGIVWLFHD